MRLCVNLKLNMRATNATGSVGNTLNVPLLEFRMQDNFSRRGLLKASAAGAVLGLVASAQATLGKPGAAAPTAGAKRSRAVRLAHLTDVHIQPERGAGDGFAQCLKHVQNLSDKPQLIVTGGDLIMDGFAADDARTALQWDLFTKVLNDNSGLRVEHTLGNHDIWGWNKSKSGSSGQERGWGKARAVEVLGLAKRHHSYDTAGWHIVHLDSVHIDPNDANGYIGKIDDEQMDWLKGDLSAVKPGTHTLVVSHIPILTATVLLDRPKKDGAFRVSGGEMHTDSIVLRELFERVGHVRACISGHIHRIDRVDFRGIQYRCNGAVSGSWWKGPNAEAVEGYTLVDLFDDGTVECEYVSYGWNARD